MNFENALHELKCGGRVQRTGWAGGTWIAIKPGRGQELAYIEMRTSKNELMPWVASSSDLLANDYMLLSAG